MEWNAFVRIRHITSGRYLGISNGEVCVIHKDKATADAITFLLTSTKVIKKLNFIQMLNKIKTISAARSSKVQKNSYMSF